MGNWTAIIVIPPVCAGENEFLDYCNGFMAEQYEGLSSFKLKEMPFVPDVLIGNFSYFNEAKFIQHLKAWFYPEPIYKVADETEQPGKYLSQLYHQTNRRYGEIQMVIRREHDDRFWYINISKERVKAYGYMEVGPL